MKLLSTILFLVFVVAGSTACKSEAEDFEETVIATPDSIARGTSATPATAAPLPALPPPALALPPVPVSLPNQVGQRPLVNPAHGLPYHDCTIAVGAPLADKGNATQPAVPGFTPTLPNLQQNPGGLKLNPAHGKPGHRCEIAVGAPLS